MTLDEFIGYVFYSFMVVFMVLGVVAWVFMFSNIVLAVLSLLGGVPCAPVPIGG